MIAKQITRVRFELLGMEHTKYTELTSVAFISEKLKRIWATAHLVSVERVEIDITLINQNLL